MTNPLDGNGVEAEPVADALEWRCAGCGALSPGKVRACDCPTNCLHVRGDPKSSAIKIDAAMDTFMAWVHSGPALAKAAGLYVGIKIYSSEQAARAAGDIS